MAIISNNAYKQVLSMFGVNVSDDDQIRRATINIENGDIVTVNVEYIANIKPELIKEYTLNKKS